MQGAGRLPPQGGPVHGALPIEQVGHSQKTLRQAHIDVAAPLLAWRKKAALGC
jgi:hypothetical protein